MWGASPGRFCSCGTPSTVGLGNALAGVALGRSRRLVAFGAGGNFGSVLRIQPPLVISDAQLETVFATVADGIAAYAAC